MEERQDLISRQAAIDAILAVTGNSSVRELYEHVQEHGLSDMWSGGVNAAIDIIIAVPSAQPEEHTETHGVCLDAIDRQAVIDTVRKIILEFFSDEDGVMNDTEKTLLSVNKAVCNGVRELPSAQPTGTPLHDNGSDYSHGFADGYKNGLKDAHTIEPQQRWIPCSERLPDELAEVNITWINTNPAPYYEFTKGKPNTGSAVYYKGRWYWYSAVCADYLAEYGFSPDDDMDDAIKVIAWMPLPEPYAERRTDE